MDVNRMIMKLNNDATPMKDKLFVPSQTEEVYTKAKWSLDTIDKNCFSITEGTPLPPTLERGGHMGACINGVPVLTGGNNWNLDRTQKNWLQSTLFFIQNKWVEGPSIPIPLGHAMYGSDDKGFYIAGGTSDGLHSSDKVFKLTSTSKDAVWETLSHLPTPLSYGSGAVLNGRFYLTGGMHDSLRSRKMWVLNLKDENAQWVECPEFKGPSRILSALVPHGKYLYLLGGLGDSKPLDVLEDAYRYDTERKSWEQLPDLPLKGYAWSGSAVDEHHILLTGRAYGKIDTGIWLLDVTTMKWERIGSTIMPATTAPLIRVHQKQWWLVGGEPDANKNRTGRISVISKY